MLFRSRRCRSDFVEMEVLPQTALPPTLSTVVADEADPVSAHGDYTAAIRAGHIEQGLLGLGGEVSEGPGATCILRGEDDFVMTDRHTLLGIAETNPCQQRPGWDDIGLNPRAPVIVTQQNVTAFAHGDEPWASHCDIEKQ